MILEALCSIAFFASLISGCAPLARVSVGYVEGEYVYLAPLETARIISLSVRRGDKIVEGQPVAMVETADAEFTLRDAQARLGQAEAELANLKRGRRPEEIAVIEATLTAARSQAQDAKRVFERRSDLFKRGFATQADLDQAQTSNEVALAKIGELSANLAVARLAARPEEILASENKAMQANANADMARWKLSQRTISATANGRIADIIRRPGEVAGPTAPVISMLPDGAVKLKIYVPEAYLSAIRVGTKIAVHCDGCKQGLYAIISYVASEPEFTPPVIYSIESRQKLVYLIEARPDSASLSALQPGQIIDAVIESAAP